MVLMRDMLFMRFVGLGMDDPVPDHSTLSKFRERIEGTGILESAMKYLERAFEKRGLRMRARVETVFGNLKNLFGLASSKWKGLGRFRLQSQLSGIAWNLFRGAKLLYA